MLGQGPNAPFAKQEEALSQLHEIPAVGHFQKQFNIEKDILPKENNIETADCRLSIVFRHSQRSRMTTKSHHHHHHHIPKHLSRK